MSAAAAPLTVSIVARLVAKPDTAAELGEFLTNAVEEANREAGTVVWFAFRSDAHTFWIFDAFASDADRQAHLDGAIAAALMANAERLLAEAPEILTADVLAVKLPAGAVAAS